MTEYNPSKIIKDGNTYNFRDDTKIPLAGSNQISGSLIPSTDGIVNLGTSTNKWKSLNGIAPDELGLPTSTYTNVSTYITNFDNTPNTFTAPVSGLLNIVVGPTAGIASVVYDITTDVMVSSNDDSYGHSRTILPVTRGDSIRVFISKSAPVAARIFHLKGKV